MWQRLNIIIGCIALAVVALVSLAPHPANALAGCCKKSTDGNSWAITDYDIDDCEKHNESDEDNVLKQAGKWWWDISC